MFLGYLFMSSYLFYTVFDADIKSLLILEIVSEKTVSFTIEVYCQDAVIGCW